MPRPKLAIEPWKESIIRWTVEEGMQQDEVCERLKKEAGLKISRGTLGRRLSAWEVRVQPKVQDTPELRERIRQLWATHVTDKEIMRILRSEGFELGDTAMVRLRKQMGLFKTDPSLRQFQEKQAQADAANENAEIPEQVDMVQTEV